MALWSRFQALIFGGAIGAAASDAVTPVLEPVRQQAWQANQHKVVDPNTAAQLAARGIISVDDATDEASRNGVASDRLQALILLSQTFPGLADLDKLSNRELIDPTLLRRALTRHGIPGSWHDPLIALFNDLISPAEVAAAVQQGHLANDGILPEISPGVKVAGGAVTPDAPDGQPPTSVPLTQLDIDPVKEAQGGGIDLERLKVLANLAGLPPGADTVLAMWNRGLIDEATVDAGIREGHLKTKWAGAFKRMRWAVLGAAEYASAHLRGWIDAEEMYKGGALTGHTKDQMDLLYLNRGRPIAPVQAFTAMARGAPGPVGAGYSRGPHPFDEQDFLRALQQSDLRTEYGPTLYGLRYAYPPLFQLGRLAQAGALPEERVRTILKYERYEPQDIDALVSFWYGGTTAKADPYVAKADGQLWTAIHRAFINGDIFTDRADNELAALVPDNATRAEVMQRWEQEKAVTVKQLTPSQIKKAYNGGELTQEAAIIRLELQNWQQADALTYLTS